jgi:YD repeat-containing protein
MASLARIGCFVVVAAVTLGPLVALADGDDKHGGDHDRDDKKPALPPSTAHGVNFVLKSQIDNNFCIDVAAGATEGRKVTLSACGTVDTERWALTFDADGQNAMIDSQGMCVDVRGLKGNDGLPVSVYKCHFGENERFSYNATGQIVEVHSRKCLSVAGAVVGSAVSLADCDVTKKGQLWKLAH